ncbi:hypothetical protein AMTRI_Chr03g52680 [Amborella trichopoda]
MGVLYQFGIIITRTNKLRSPNFKFINNSLSYCTSSSPPSHPSPQNHRSRTPLEKQFESWIHKLKPGFTPQDVDDALRNQSDPDLALDIFRWTSNQRHYRHTDLTYYTMLRILASENRFKQIETLIAEVMAGACSPSPPLFNTIINHFCKRKLLGQAIDAFKKMQRDPNCKLTLQTYTMILNSVLQKFTKLNVSCIYLHTVRSLMRQMKATGIVPDTFTLNLVIKAYSKCLEMDEAIRVFKEMVLYGCEPDAYTYNYISKGLCEKGRVSQGLKFFREMREKGFVPSSGAFMIVICSLALERRFDEAIEVLFDMLGNSMVPDFLTYKTVLEGLGREGREKQAYELLEELKKKDGLMDLKTYSSLLNCLHLLDAE